MCRESERKKKKTNRSGKFNLQGTAAERGSLESVLSGFGVFDALEEHERVTASGVWRHAVECAVFGEELHQIGVGDVRRQIPHPQVVRRTRQLVEIPRWFRRKRHCERRSALRMQRKLKKERERGWRRDCFGSGRNPRREDEFFDTERKKRREGLKNKNKWFLPDRKDST